MMLGVYALLISWCCPPTLGLAQAAGPATQQFHVTLLRAAPGQLASLIERWRGLRAAAQGDLIIMRHSQGDHWDLMILQPAGNGLPTVRDHSDIAHFQHDFLASGDQTWQQIKQHAADNTLFHIEMFHATAGKKAELLRQREMENRYYHATGRAGNAIFTTVFGSDVDYFTIGFYRDLAAFASDPDLPPEQYEAAAKQAGFSSRDTIGLYLRELIISHHDTLAVSVK